MSSGAPGEPRLIVVLGPTASGKSALGIEMARQFGGEVVVCDSTQAYRHFDIGTAKVPPSEQQGIPHHLTDLCEPDEVFTAGEYRRRALEVLEDLKRRGKTPVLTAGTGLYLRALLQGLAAAPERSEELRERLRAAAAEHGREHIHGLLKELDPEAAEKIAPRDVQKAIRAVEIRMLARKAVGDVHRSGRDPLRGFAVTKIGLNPDRQALNARIDRRTREMIAAGWVDEVRGLRDRGLSPDAKPFQFIGYAQLWRYLLGALTQEEAVAQIQLATRQFAKRQMTWFRREPGVLWIEGFGGDEKVVAKAGEHLAATP
jgi:tRNA dimethylallyltransferase